MKKDISGGSNFRGGVGTRIRLMYNTKKITKKSKENDRKKLQCSVKLQPLMSLYVSF